MSEFNEILSQLYSRFGFAKDEIEKYIIIEDYGNEKFEGVKQAVDEVCWFGHMEIVQGIGYPAGTQHGTMKYNDWEAVICRTLKK